MPSAPRYAPSSLTAGLIDDAAIFPPGLAPLDEAMARHRALRQSPLAPYIGPFLLRASWWQEFIALSADSDNFDIVLICRPDEDIRDIEAAVRGLTDWLGAHSLRQTTRLCGIEMPWAAADTTENHIATLTSQDKGYRTITFEIDGAAADVDLAAIARYGMRTGIGTLGKFRTGGIRPEDSPPPERLASVVTAAARQHVPVKFTAGLHHAVTGPHGPGGSVQFGVLNVIAAVRQAVSAGDEYDAALVEALAATLMRTDATSLAAEAISLNDDDIDAVRSVFTSFGCCGVTEPLTELAELGVIPEPPEGPQP